MVESISTTTEGVSSSADQESYWDTVITPKKPLFDLKLKELWKHRDLLFLVVKRDFVALYKQTILGPIWFFLQPLLMSLMFTVVFGRFAGIPTDGIPKMVFYLAGLTNWIYFSEVFKKISTTFKDNQQIFGKVYFPRLVMPFAVTLTGLLRYVIQLLLFLGYYFYHLWLGAPMQPNQYLWLLPVLVISIIGVSVSCPTAFKLETLFDLTSIKYRLFSFSAIISISPHLQEKFFS
jgi:lipopolysaccharide transport system permease protein